MQLLIEGCRKHDRESQRLLYQHYYAYGMSICVRYSRSVDEAKEILNDGFLKIFTKIDQHSNEQSFKGWIRKILIHSAIDHYRKEVKHYNHQEFDSARGDKQVTNTVLDELSYVELIGMVQHLSPAYRAVFNLYVIDGYNHEEIGKMLNISPGTSKSNLMKARMRLKKMIEEATTIPLKAKYV